jgi:Flp pilus assembly protein TadD
MSRHGWPLIVLLCGWLAASSGCTSARSVARKLAPDSKRDFEMRLTMAQVHEQEGKLPKAAAVYADLLAENPKHTKLCHRYGIVQLGLGKDDEGIQLLEKANAGDPNNPEILSDLGYAYLMSGEIERAETLLRQSYELDPGNPRTIGNLALAAGLAGRYEESQALYEEVMTKAEAQANLGYICAQRGEGQQAMGHYNRALDLDPSLKPAAEALMQLAEMKQDFDSEQPAIAQWAARQTSAEPAELVPDPIATIRLTSGESDSHE